MEKERSKLNQRRAKQIASSPIMANVTYEGMPVYIERVNDMTGTAYIHSLDMPGMRREVFVSELTEEQ
jgi:small acid-soluble spore protein H (minor)